MEYTQNFTNFKVSKNTKCLKYISFPEDLHLPLKFDDNKKRIVEIGFGNGEVMTRMAKSRSNDMFIGIENSEISCVKAAKRVLDMGLNNVMIFQGDAKFLVQEVFEPSSIDLMLSFYPIPWPKNSHEKRRLFSEEFLKNALRTLKKDGKFLIVTDDEDHVEWITDNALKIGAIFSKRNVMPLKTTKYGRKWNEMGRKSWSIIMESHEFSTSRMVIDWMPHVHLKDISFEKINEIASKKFVENESIIQFKGVFKGDEGYLLKTISVDDGFVQTYYIIVKKEKDGWLARLDEGIKVFKTHAVKKSVEIVGNFIAGG
ncbi:MAG: tRNA (guanosine(46)-N7)-methyltransferase TrmB [Athalassotoga sp.]|uniref:tRNA (guanosine(46)-N7)-methyltransferase TrmB n=1 Tax=Athalassotoga sp. TaxID=2022597 RepID=UPI003CFF54C7